MQTSTLPTLTINSLDFSVSINCSTVPSAVNFLIISESATFEEFSIQKLSNTAGLNTFSRRPRSREINDNLVNVSIFNLEDEPLVLINAIDLSEEGIFSRNAMVLTPEVTLCNKIRAHLTVEVLTVLSGSGSADNIGGSIESEFLDGRGGNDLLRAREGNDVLEGDDGRDTLRGGQGEDSLIGGVRNDVLVDGNGIDQFTIQARRGRDTATDFQDGVDILRLGGNLSFSDLTISSSGGGANTAISIANTGE